MNTALAVTISCPKEINRFNFINFLIFHYSTVECTYNGPASDLTSVSNIKTIHCKNFRYMEFRGQLYKKGPLEKTFYF